jgi:hypothetical protein
MFLGKYRRKYVQGVYEEYYKTLVKEIKENSNKWSYIPNFWIGSLNIV